MEEDNSAGVALAKNAAWAIGLGVLWGFVVGAIAGSQNGGIKEIGPGIFGFGIVGALGAVISIAIIGTPLRKTIAARSGFWSLTPFLVLYLFLGLIPVLVANRLAKDSL